MVYVYLCALVTITIGTSIGAFYAWSRRQIPGARPFAGMLLALVGWALCDIFAAVSANADMAYVIESKIRFLFITGTYLSATLTALDYVGLHTWLKPHRIALLAIIPVTTQLVIWFGPSDAFIADITYVQEHGFYLPDSRTFGPWFTVHSIYGYVLAFITLITLLTTAIRSRYPYRGQALFLIAGASILIASSAFRAFSSGGWLRYDLVVLSFTGTGTVWLIGLFRYGLLNIAPIARTSVIEQMADLVIVLNRANQIVDFNLAAAQQFNWTPPMIIGQPLRVVAAEWPSDILDYVATLTEHNPETQRDIGFELQLEEQIYELRISSLRQRGKRLVGWLLMLHDVTEREWIARQLAASEARMSNLLLALPDLVFRLDGEGHYLDVWGDKQQRSHDIPRQLVRGKTMFDLLPNDVAHYIHQQILQALATNQPQTIEYQLPTVSGLTDFEARIIPSGPNEVLSAARDITERKHMERALQQREEETRAFQDKLLMLHDITIELAQLNNLPSLYQRAIELARDQFGFERIGIFMRKSDDPDMLVGTFGIDPQGQLRDERSLQIPIQEGSIIYSLLAEKKHFAVRENTRLWDNEQIVGQGWHATAALWNGAESIGWLVADNLLSQVPLAAYQMEILALYGRTLGYLVTHLKQRAALRESEARFRLLSEATFEGVMVHDGHTIIDANSALAAMFGYPLATLIGMHVTDIAAPEAQDEVSQKSASTGPEIYEAQGLRRDGTVFPAEIHARPFLSGHRILRVAAIRDLTHRKQAEEDAILVALERERVQLLANFITHATHEFRTPLSVINMRAHLLGQVDDPAKRETYVINICEQVGALSNLVNDLVKMAQLDVDHDLTLLPTNINDLIHGLHQRMRGREESAHLTFIVDLQPNLPYIMGNVTRLTLAFTKLLDNAIRYTPPGGTITLRTWHNEETVFAEIRDTGVGMTSTQMDRIFERFYRADEAHSTRGFGLGLPIAQRVLELHGGWIEVESVAGEGSVFRVALPSCK